MFNFGWQGDVLERVYLRYCDCLFGGRIRQKVGCGFGEESFAGARWSREEDIMVPRDCDSKRTFSEGLPFDVI